MSQSGESNPHGEHEESTERASGAGGSIPSADAHDAVTALGSPNGVDTNSLEVAYLDFVTIMLRRLARRAESSGLHLTAYSTVQFVDATSYYQRFRMHPDYRELLLAYDARSQLPEEVRAQLDAAEGRARVEPTEEEETEREVIDRCEEISEDSGTDWPQAMLRAIRPTYQRYLASWSAPSVRWEVIVPLTHFEADLDAEDSGIPLGEHLWLAPFTPETKSALWNVHARSGLASVMPPPLDFATVSKATWCLTGTELYPRGGEPRPSQAAAEVADLVTAFRLLKGGGIAAPVTAMRCETPSPWQSGWLSYGVPGGRHDWTPTPTYRLEEADIPEARALVTNLRQLTLRSHQGGLAVALRRFNQAYARDWLTGSEDRIIDLTIALESTLLADVQDELQYRLALRGAAILSDTRAPSETRLLLETIYKVRSKIVHEGRQLAELSTLISRIPVPSNEADGFARMCEDTVREVLRTYVRSAALGKTPKTVNAELDKRIVQGMTNAEDISG